MITQMDHFLDPNVMANDKTLAEFKTFIAHIMNHYLDLEYCKLICPEDAEEIDGLDDDIEIDGEIADFFEKLIVDGRMADCIILAKMLLKLNILPLFFTLNFTRNNLELCKLYAELPDPITIDPHALYELMDKNHGDPFDNVVMYLCEKFPDKYLKTVDGDLKKFTLEFLRNNNMELFEYLNNRF
jgi:hypothetical protein